MEINKEEKKELAEFFSKITADHDRKKDKFEQIIAYLNVIKAVSWKYSASRPLMFADCCAGRCYLSLLTYHYFSRMSGRQITIFCIDANEELMSISRNTAEELGFSGMNFFCGDIMDFRTERKIDLVYSLHACNDATDKTIWLGIRNNASSILSVSCCQHDLISAIQSEAHRGMMRHSIYRDRLAYMAGDSLRALLLETRGYETKIREFVSAKHTDKNTMIRATVGNRCDRRSAAEEYRRLSSLFGITPTLERYMIKNADA